MCVCVSLFHGIIHFVCVYHHVLSMGLSLSQCMLPSPWSIERLTIHGLLEHPPFCLGVKSFDTWIHISMVSPCIPKRIVLHHASVNSMKNVTFKHVFFLFSVTNLPVIYGAPHGRSNATLWRPWSTGTGATTTATRTRRSPRSPRERRSLRKRKRQVGWAGGQLKPWVMQTK